MKRWNAGGWAIIAAAFVTVAVLATWAFVRWPLYAGGAALFTGATALGALGMWLACRSDVLAAEAAAVEAAATGRDLAAVGPVTDRTAAERALVAALFAVWDVDEPDPTSVSATHGMAAEVLDHLERHGCRLLVPNTRRRPAPAAPRVPEPAQPPRVTDPIPLWPGIGGAS